MVGSALHVDRRSMLDGTGFAQARGPSTHRPSDDWQAEFDVIVVGSGAAGSAAALFAASAGARVAMLEKSDQRGGTTALSDGRYWIPNHPGLSRIGLSDPKGDFLRFVARSSFPGRYRKADDDFGVDPSVLELMRTFYDRGPTLVAEMERLGIGASLISAHNDESLHGAYDYPPHAAENACPHGRSLALNGDASRGGGARLVKRFATALDANGVQYKARHAVRSVVRDKGRVVGIVCEADGQTVRLRARKGVVFATGGFLQDPAKRSALHLGPLYNPQSASGTTGDFMSIASSCGAMLGNLNSAWRIQAVLHPLPEYGGVRGDYSLPADSGLIVNGAGRRCLNEAASAHDRARTMSYWDANSGSYPELLNFYVYDERAADLFAGNYPLPEPGKTAPWVLTGTTIPDLAAAIGREVRAFAKSTGGAMLARDFAQQLETAITRFNAMAATGVDEDFARGASEGERYRQSQFLDAAKDKKRRGAMNDRYPNMCLHPLSRKGPYHAVILVPSAVDSNGGPVIDPAGRVLDNLHRPIPGLYAAGNCVASPARDAPWGPGAATALALTFGMLAGRAAAAASPSEAGPTAAAPV